MTSNQCRGCGQWAGRGHRCAIASPMIPPAARASVLAEALRQTRREFSPANPQPTIVSRLVHVFQWSRAERDMRRASTARVERAQNALSHVENG